MKNITPFADAISGPTTTNTELTQIDILRKSNHELKLELIELKNKVKEQSAALDAIRNILKDDEI